MTAPEQLVFEAARLCRGLSLAESASLGVLLLGPNPHRAARLVAAEDRVNRALSEAPTEQRGPLGRAILRRVEGASLEARRRVHPQWWQAWARAERPEAMTMARSNEPGQTWVARRVHALFAEKHGANDPRHRLFPSQARTAELGELVELGPDRVAGVLVTAGVRLAAATTLAQTDREAIARRLGPELGRRFRTPPSGSAAPEAAGRLGLKQLMASLSKQRSPRFSALTAGMVPLAAAWGLGFEPELRCLATSLPVEPGRALLALAEHLRRRPMGAQAARRALNWALAQDAVTT